MNTKKEKKELIKIFENELIHNNIKIEIYRFIDYFTILIFNNYFWPSIRATKGIIITLFKKI